MKNTIYAIMLLLMLASVSAATLQVKAVDQDNNLLSGVIVAPEFKFSFFGGWNDFLQKERTTDANGIAGTWLLSRTLTIQVNSAELEGYTCTRGESTRKVSTSGENQLVTVCTKEEDHSIPEFSVIAAIMTLGIVIAGFFLLRKQ